MKWIFTIILALHGLIHILGFIKAFELSEIKELTLHVSRPWGILWLLVTLTFLVYGYLQHNGHQNAWMVGLVAVVVSQILILSFWQDANYGTIPNILIGIVLLFAYASYSFEAMVEKERSDMLGNVTLKNTGIIEEQDLKGLPAPVQKWLIHSGIIGKTKILNGKISQKARIKLKPEQKDWNTAIAEQYTSISEPSFIWTVDMKLNSIMWIKGRDKFQDGRGEMLIKVNSMITIVHEYGEKIDEGSLQRFLGEMVWFPSLALSPYINWESIDSLTSRATMTYKGTIGNGTFHFNEDGDFIKFTAMRYQGNNKDAERKEWILTVDDYQVFNGIKIPSKMKAKWKHGDRYWTWLELEIDDIQYNFESQE